MTRRSARMRSAAGSTLAALVAAALLSSGCSSTSVVSADAAAQQVSDVLAEQVGQRPDGVECPDDLNAEVGAEMRCQLIDGEETYGVTIRITEVTDGVASFDIEVDPDPA